MKIKCIKDKYGSLIPIDKITYISKDYWVSTGEARRDIDHNALELLLNIFEEANKEESMQEETLHEPRESEDEKYYKKLHDCLSSFVEGNPSYILTDAKGCLAWLEKQGEQKQIYG